MTTPVWFEQPLSSLHVSLASLMYPMVREWMSDLADDFIKLKRRYLPDKFSQEWIELQLLLPIKVKSVRGVKFDWESVFQVCIHQKGRSLQLTYLMRGGMHRIHHMMNAQSELNLWSVVSQTCCWLDQIRSYDTVIVRQLTTCIRTTFQFVARIITDLSISRCAFTCLVCKEVML